MIDKTNIKEKYGFKPFPSIYGAKSTEFIRDPFLVVFISEELIKIQKFEEGDNGFKFGKTEVLRIIKTSGTKLFEEILEQSNYYHIILRKNDYYSFNAEQTQLS